MSIQAIKEEVDKLSRAEQAELMHYMIELMSNTAFELSEEWKLEILSREAALENNTSVGKTAREVIAKYTNNK